MDLFIILILEEEVCVLRQNSSREIMCGMDVLVPRGTEVNRALTSKDVMTSPGSTFAC